MRDGSTSGVVNPGVDRLGAALGPGTRRVMGRGRRVRSRVARATRAELSIS